jgi:two-component system sensor histidine kinase KdpD
LKRLDDSPFSLEERSFVEALTHQTTVSLQRQLLFAEAAKTRVLEESERMHKLLLNSLSHELRTPITAIKSAVSNLGNPALIEDPKIRETLLREIAIANERLNRLIINLLDISRLESGHLKPRLDWCDVADLVQTSLHSLQDQLSNHSVRVNLDNDLPLIFADYVLMEQVLKNLILNAATHSHKNQEISVRGYCNESGIHLEIIDSGPAINAADLPLIFEKFYRGPKTHSGGLGLGLAISKGFAEIQGATLNVSATGSGGNCFMVTIPRRTLPVMEGKVLSHDGA